MSGRIARIKCDTGNRDKIETEKRDEREEKRKERREKREHERTRDTKELCESVSVKNASDTLYDGCAHCLSHPLCVCATCSCVK